MRVIIEGYNYRADAVRSVLHELSPLESVEGAESVSYVGYYYNPQLRDCVFILPKVLVNAENKVFSRLDPHDIIDLDTCDLLTTEERNFIYEFAVWIYRTIDVYNRSNPKNDIIYRRQIVEQGRGKRMVSNTFLDILLSLLRFSQEHRHFFTTTLHNLHSGYNKINWTRTISHATAWIQQGVPVYLNPINKKRQINTDEELIVIYLSILRYISDTYGFPVQISLGYDLITGRKFAHYIEGYGKRRLKQIKYRCFSDVQLRLWDLCYAFLDMAHRIHIVAEQREYLLAKNFNIVFEAVIDELIGDHNLPPGLKDQPDGKRVDHLFSYPDLTHTDRNIYYIGDSKYYRIGHPISRESVYKQFTYARNVIQWNLSLFLPDHPKESGDADLPPKYRDDLTEGYNIVPNFFISAAMDEKLSYRDNVSPTSLPDNVFISQQFVNRLFDRDTLLVYHYEVNFLYVVSLYARNNQLQKHRWRDKVRELFRIQIRKNLQEKYDFYAMSPRPGLRHEAYLQAHFQELLGKVYCPYSDDTQCLSLALDQGEKQENDRLLDKLKRNYYVITCPLGKDPAQVLSDTAVRDATPASERPSGVLMVMGNHLKKAPTFVHSGEIAIGIKQTKRGMEIIHHLDEIGQLLFLTRGNQHLFFVSDTPEVLTADEAKAEKALCRFPKTCEIYLRVKFDTRDEAKAEGLHPQNLRVKFSKGYDAAFVTRDLLE